MGNGANRKIHEQPVVQISTLLLALAGGFGARHYGMATPILPPPSYIGYGILAERIASNEKMIQYYMRSTDDKIKNLRDEIRARLPLKADSGNLTKIGENDG